MKDDLSRLRARLERAGGRDTPAGRLARALKERRPATSDCDLWREELPALVDAELMGLSPRKVAPELAAHLEFCDECGQLYAEMLEAAWLASKGPLPVDEAIPEPDLSFLPKPKIDLDILWHVPLQNTWNAVVDAAGSLQKLLVEVTVPRPLPSLAPLRGTLTDKGEERTLLVVEMEEHGGLGLEVRATRYSASPERCTLTLTMDSPRPDAPRPRRAVISYAGGRLVAEVDDLGQAHFPDVPLASLADMRVEIEMR